MSDDMVDNVLYGGGGDLVLVTDLGPDITFLSHCTTYIVGGCPLTVGIEVVGAGHGSLHKQFCFLFTILRTTRRTITDTIPILKTVSTETLTLMSQDDSDMDF